MKEQRSGSWSPELSNAEKATLFTIARETLTWCTNKLTTPFDFSGYTLTDKLKQEMATFVTLKQHGQLRGCIGSLEPVTALYDSVHDNTVNAALRDNRFRQVTAEEASDLDIHVSILSPVREVPSVDDFILGEHGIIIQRGAQRAVFLPEVATEQGWSKEETLAHLCMKAGMPSDAWKTDTRFSIFSSAMLSERHNEGDGPLSDSA